MRRSGDMLMHKPVKHPEFGAYLKSPTTMTDCSRLLWLELQEYFTHFVKSCIHNCFHRCHIEMDAAEVNFNNLGKTYPNTVCTKDTLSIVQCDRVHAECLWRPLSLSTFPEFRSGRCSKELFLRKLRTT